MMMGHRSHDAPGQRLACCCALVVALIGCDPGTIGDPPIEELPSGSSASGDDTVGTTKAAQCSLSSPGPMRRLTREEYDNAVRDLLGVTGNPSSAFPPDENSYGFPIGLSVSSLLIEQYMKTAEKLSKATDLDDLLTCTTSNGNDACARQFIKDFGLKAYRRPLTQAERDRLFKVYQQGKATSFSQGVQLALQAMLQSPFFVYRFEKGKKQDSGAVKLSGYEVASRLAFYIWKSTPDDKLLDAAETGQLSTPAQVAAQARRMLEDKRAKGAMINFFTHWLELDKLDDINKDKTTFSTFSSQLAKDMKTETTRFVEEVMLRGDGKLSTLLSANWSMVNKRLASHYGVTGPTGDKFERVSFDKNERAGLLTHASVLSIQAKHNQTSPVHRGKFVRERLLCQTIPNPPPNLVVKPPKLDPKLSTRQRFERHRKDPACKGCHKLMDPIGFGFENYDGIGRYRTKEGSLNVDARGELYGTKDVNGPFDGAVELAKKLVKSGEVQECMVRQWFRYAQGRVEGPGDACTIQSAKAVFAKSGYDVRELIVALTQTPAFLYRTGKFKVNLDAVTSGSSTVLPTPVSASNGGSEPPLMGGCGVAGGLGGGGAPPSWGLALLLLVALQLRRKAR